jgi:hypothetical protein
MTALPERRWRHLTRHFFAGLFDLGFLSDTGTESFTRMVLGCCVVFFSFGLLITRIFTAAHALLPSAEAFRLALLANHAFLIAVPMWIVSFVTVLVGHSLFPDETDYRVLMALPVPRHLIFGAKLLALALFAALFILSAHVALLPLSLLMSTGMFVGFPWPVQFSAYLVASLLASGFSVMAVAAVQGLLILTAPRGRLLAVSAALRSAMLCVLVIVLPLVLRLPAQAGSFANGSWWLYAAPPVWFLGVERWLLGDVSRGYVIPLTAIAGAAVASAAALAVGSYVYLYRRFDRVLVQPVPAGARADRRVAWTRSARPVRSRPVFVAVRTFTRLTLRRSVLHQGILVAVSAAGAGLVANSLIGAGFAGWVAGGGRAGAALVASVVWAPFALIFVASLAVRLALAVPIDQRANWVFRITEEDGARVEQLAAAVHTVRRLGVVVPLLLMAPLEAMVLGWDTIGVSAVALLCGWLLVEILMRHWDRIPFTCSYIPGKGFVPQSILTGFSSFVLFTTAGSGLAWFSAIGRPAALAFDAVLFASVLALRRRRLITWRGTPLAFEDQLPVEVSPLRLSLD